MIVPLHGVQILSVVCVCVCVCVLFVCFVVRQLLIRTDSMFIRIMRASKLKMVLNNYLLYVVTYVLVGERGDGQSKGRWLGTINIGEAVVSG